MLKKFQGTSFQIGIANYTWICSHAPSKLYQKPINKYPIHKGHQLNYKLKQEGSIHYHTSIH
jgi:hypothetical protein